MHERVFLYVVRVGKYAVRFFDFLSWNQIPDLSTCLFYSSSLTSCAVLVVWSCSYVHVSAWKGRNSFCEQHFLYRTSVVCMYERQNTMVYVRAGVEKSGLARIQNPTFSHP